MKKLVLIVVSVFVLSLSSSCVTAVRPAQSHVVVVKKAPRYHKVVVVKGKRYYAWNGKHYRKTKKGYVFVKI